MPSVSTTVTLIFTIDFDHHNKQSKSPISGMSDILAIKFASGNHLVYPLLQMLLAIKLAINFSATRV